MKSLVVMEVSRPTSNVNPFAFDTRRSYFCLHSALPQMFLRLPAEVVRCIILEWLNVRSICRLDSACCSEEDRTEFLEQISAGVEQSTLLDWQQALVRGTNCLGRRIYGPLAKFYIWASSRHLKVSYLEIDGDTELAVLAKYLPITGLCVRSVKFSLLRSDKMESRNSLAINSVGNLQKVQIFFCTLTANFRDLLLVCAGTLRKLSMTYCKNVAPKYFVGIKCPHLTTVTTSCDPESTTAILSMSDRITHLRCVHAYCDSYLYSFLSLPCCAGLQKLNLSRSSVGDVDIIAVCDNCTQLEAIDLHDCKLLTDVAITALVTRCSHLRTLWISYNDNYTDTSLQAIARHAPFLQSFNVTVCCQLTTAALLNVVTACQSLHTFLLDKSVYDSTRMLQIAQHLPGTITHLYSGESEIPNAVLMAVAQRCPVLEHLDMRYCTALTQGQQQCMAAVASGCLRLRTVVMPEKEQSAQRGLWQALRPDVRVLTSLEQPVPSLF